MSSHAVHFTSAKDDWRTPAILFAALNAEFNFTVDGCASDTNALLPRYWTQGDEPLLRSWAGERVFINPPYGRQIARWMEKAWTEAPDAELIVALIPSRTDTGWWHDYVMQANEIRFLRRRLCFGVDTPKKKDNSAPFPSAVVVWRSGTPPTLAGPDRSMEFYASPVCDGSSECKSLQHIHGCFAERPR